MNREMLKTPGEQVYMRQAGRVLAGIFEQVPGLIRPGVTLTGLAAGIERLITASGAEPAFKGYRGFPAAVCLSVNRTVIHGIPDATVLQNGDLLSVDIGVSYAGYHADAARTVAVGRVAAAAAELALTARLCFERATQRLFPGALLRDVSAAIEQTARDRGVRVVRRYGGHGIGRALHEPPHVFNYAVAEDRLVLQPGMTLALEPIVTDGTGAVETAADGWSVVTADGALAAHYEDTVLITEDGAEILTRKKGEPLVWSGRSSAVGLK